LGIVAVAVVLHRDWLAANRAGREAFLAIALKLAAQQHPVGSELLTVAAQRFGALE